MKNLNINNNIDVVNEYKKDVSYVDTSFDEYNIDDDFTYSIKQIFYRDEGFSYDYVYKQNLLFNDNYLFFQIPVDDRRYGLVEGSIKLNVGDYTIVDDDHGNLYEYDNGIIEDVQIGNIFYDSGCIFITADNNFSGTTTDIVNYINSNQKDLEFKKYIFLRERAYLISVSENEYNFTTNNTWDEDKPMFFNQILLYNDNYEVMATANISRNIPLENNITIMLESIEVY